MFRIIVVAASVCVCSVAVAQALTVRDVKAMSAVQLSTEDLNQLMPGAKVEHVAANGNIRRWENKPDGTLVASSDNTAQSGGRAFRTTGSGTWRVENGKFCIAIKWNTISEDTCRYIFKADGKYFGIFKVEDTELASQFKFSK